MIRQLRGRLSTTLLGLLAILLVSLALRLNKLDAQSFWYDEGNSARIAERSLQLIVEGAAGDIHPPLYYLALSDWRAVFGESEVALRWLSVVCGVLLVLFTHLTGRAAFNPRTGLIAAALIAFSPFAVYYSQEARMYILLALEAAVSTWALFKILDFGVTAGDSGEATGPSPIINQRSSVILFVLSTAAGLYTQYAYPFVMLAQGACVLLWLAASGAPFRSKARVTIAYAAMNLVAIALFLPWLPIAVRQVASWAVAPVSYDTGAAVLDAFRWLVVGRTLPPEQATLPLVVAGGLAILGILLDVRTALRAPAPVEPAEQPPRKGSTLTPRDWPFTSSILLPATMLLILAVLPFVLLFAFNLYREAYLKFLLVCAAPLLTLAAHGIDRAAGTIARGSAAPEPHDGTQRVRGSLLAITLSALMILTLLPSLGNLYSNPAYARDDYRGIARMIDAGARPGDAILFDAPNQWEVFTYYHRSGAPAIALPYRPESEGAVDEVLKPIAARYQRLFMLYYGERESDPGTWIERWLAVHTFKADEEWVGNIRLATYATRTPGRAANPSIVFGDVTRLEAVAVDLSPRQVGDMITLRLTWRAGVKPDRRYKVFVHLGTPNAPPVAQNDAEPVAGFHPTDTWDAGEDVVDQRAVWLKPGTPAGTYGLYMGMYDGASGQRLQVIHSPGGQLLGDRLWLGDVVVK